MPFSCSVDTVNTAIFSKPQASKDTQKVPFDVSLWMVEGILDYQRKQTVWNNDKVNGMWRDVCRVYQWMTDWCPLAPIVQANLVLKKKIVMSDNSCSGWSSPYVGLSAVSLKGFLGGFRWGESCWALLICIKNLMQKRRGQLDCLHREALKREVLKLQIVWPNNRCTVGCRSCNI